MTARLHEIVERAAATMPAQPAIRDHDGRSVSYGELDALAGEAAALLRREGVGEGDRVAVVGENALSMVALMLGASRCRATFTLLNARLAPAEIERCLAHAKPRAVLFCTGVSADAKLLPRLVEGPDAFGAVGTHVNGSARCFHGRRHGRT